MGIPESPFSLNCMFVQGIDKVILLNLFVKDPGTGQKLGEHSLNT